MAQAIAIGLIFLLVLIGAAYLVGNAMDPNPIDTGKGAKLEAEARVAELAAAQQREFDAEQQAYVLANEQHKQELYATWKPTVSKVGTFAINTLYVFLLVLLYTASHGTVVIGKGVSTAVVKILEVRAGVAPIDKETRMPRTLIMDLPALPEPKEDLPADASILAKFQAKTGIQLTKMHNRRWIALNAATGQVVAKFDQNVPATARMDEIYRQAALTAIVAMNMKKIAWAPKGAPVAEHMADNDFRVPGTSVMIDPDAMIEKLAERLTVK